MGDEADPSGRYRARIEWMVERRHLGVTRIRWDGYAMYMRFGHDEGRIRRSPRQRRRLTGDDRAGGCREDDHGCSEHGDRDLRGYIATWPGRVQPIRSRLLRGDDYGA
jgi:hypothetical protein